jgi:carboxyl-terminal processing protease
MAVPTAVTSGRFRDDIGYLKVAFFPGATGQLFADAFYRAMESVGSCKRMIIDLRGNLGGFVGALGLIAV